MNTPKTRLIRFGSAKRLTRAGTGVLLPETNQIKRYDPA